MDLETLLRELMGKPLDEVVGAMQNKAHALYQAIFDRGHGAKTAEANIEITRITNDLNKAKNDLADAQRLATESKTEPADWQKQRQQYDEQIRTLTTQLDTVKRESGEQLSTVKRESKLSELKSKLIGRKVHPDYAQVLVEKEENKNRIGFNDDGSLKVLQAGKTIPLSVAEGQDALDLLADELVGKTDQTFIMKKGDRGSGQSGSDAPAAGGSYLSDLKERVIKQREEQQKTRTDIPLQDRLKVVR